MPVFCVCVCVLRETPDVTPCHTSPPRGVPTSLLLSSFLPSFLPYHLIGHGCSRDYGSCEGTYVQAVVCSRRNIPEVANSGAVDCSAYIMTLAALDPVQSTRRSGLRAGTFKLLPVEVRCYILCLGCLARNARCNTMSHFTAAAMLLYTSRMPDVTPCHASPPQGVVDLAPYMSI